MDLFLKNALIANCCGGDVWSVDLVAGHSIMCVDVEYMNIIIYTCVLFELCFLFLVICCVIVVISCLLL